MSEQLNESSQARQRSEAPGSAPAVATLHRLLVESVGDYAIFVLDPDGNVLSWNAGAARLKGYVADEIIGRHFSAFYTPEDIRAEKPDRELRVAAREGRVEDEGWRVRKDGSRFWANVVITALRDEQATLLGFAKVTRDLTLRRDAEEASRRQAAAEAARREAERHSDELAKLNEQLRQQAIELEAQTEEAQSMAEEVEQSNEALSEALAAAEQARAEAEAANRTKARFLGTMSHELRTPLNAIEGYVQLLEMGIPDQPSPAQLGYLTRIRGAQRLLFSLVNNVLALATIEAGHLEYRIETVPVAELWDAVEPLVAHQARAKDLSYQVRPYDPSIAVRADRERAVQVLLNLVGNAIKFTLAGGRIELETEVVGQHVALRVRDSGIGIAADLLDAIFQPFVQGNAATRSAQGGVGLGLSISRDLARHMSGDVTADSTLGQGSTFTFALPRAG